SDIRNVARVHGAPTLFVLIPATYQVDTAEFHRSLSGFRIAPSAVDLDQPNRLLAAAMHAHNLDVFDALPDFRRADRAGTRLHGAVDRHLSPAGHDLLEHLVEPLVVARLETARRPTAPAVAVPALPPSGAPGRGRWRAVGGAHGSGQG